MSNAKNEESVTKDRIKIESGTVKLKQSLDDLQSEIVNKEYSIGDEEAIQKNHE